MVSHAAVYKFGGITIPLFTLFGEEAVLYRMNASEAKFLITDVRFAQPCDWLKKMKLALYY